MRKISALLCALVCLAFCSCVGLSTPDTPSLEGRWGMVSGGIEKYGDLQLLEGKSGHYKTMEFRSDGTFTEECGVFVAQGTYKIKGGDIKYTYTEIPSNDVEYFAIHESGTWIYKFWGENTFTLYDYASSALEVSMSFERLK